MKRIIFDVDNTLIPWKDEYKYSINEGMNRSGKNYTVEEIDIIYDKLSYIADHINDFNYDTIINYMKNECNITLDYDFLDKVLEEQSKCYEKAPSYLIDTLEYLYKKYDLVILSNWFRSCQEERLAGSGILKYFKEIYCCDEYPSKPTKEAFITALNGEKPNDCVMVGDNIEIDLNPASELGIKTILINKPEEIVKLKEVL